MLDDSDIETLARLHAQCLPDSLVASLGLSYVRAFYRYLAQSSTEVMCVERAGGRLVAAAAVTLEPHTFTRRLLRHTPLPASLIRHGLDVWEAMKRTASKVGTAPDAPTTVAPETPEMILLFAAPEVRGAGWGSRVVARVDDELRARGVRSYQVKTEAEAGNRALDFYRGRGFEPAGVAVRFGTPFQVFLRRLE